MRANLLVLVLPLIGILSCAAPSQPVIPDGSTRLVQHAMGETIVPEDPQRVVVLDTSALDAAIALRIYPVGTLIYGTLPDYLGDSLTEIDIVGEYNQPNVEAILRLDPDLILGTRANVAAIKRQLDQIAPTILTQESGRDGNWQDNFRLYAQALGHSGEAEEKLQDYQDQVQQLSNLIGSPSAFQVSVITQSGDSLGSYTTGSFAGAVLQDVGLARNPAQAQSDRFAIQLSQERLDTIDGDLLFLIHTHHLADSVSQSDFVADPLWSQLAVVQQGGVCEVNGAVWIAGRGILAAQQILRDVEKCWKQVAQSQTE